MGHRQALVIPMRFLLIAATAILLPSSALAQEEIATASTGKAPESCSVTKKIDLTHWQDFADSLTFASTSPIATPRRQMKH